MMQLTSLSRVAAAALALQETGQREAERRDGPGVQEIAAAMAIAERRGPVGVKSDHRRNSPGGKVILPRNMPRVDPALENAYPSQELHSPGDHNVHGTARPQRFFKLGDSSEANVAALVAACKKYLNVQPGIVLFAAGPICKELARPVNDQNWDVGLHIVFDSKASHDSYQDDPNHVKFVTENKPTWAGVRVFDSYV